MWLLQPGACPSPYTRRMELHHLRVALPATPPYSLATTCEVLAAASPFRTDLVLGPGSLTRALLVGGAPVVVRVTEAGESGHRVLACDLFAAAPPATGFAAAATAAVTAFLGLRDDLTAFYRVAARDEAMAPLVRRLHGYRQVRFPTPFEAAAWAVLSQHNHWNVARKMKDALVAELGMGLVMDGVDHRVFPSPVVVVAAGPDLLHWLLRNERRALSLFAVAEAFADVDPRFLMAAPVGEVDAWLRRIHGIGPWSAAFILQRGVGRPDAPLLVDQSLVRATLTVYGPHRILRMADVAGLAERYGDQQGIWAHYLRVAAWLDRRGRTDRR